MSVLMKLIKHDFQEKIALMNDIPLDLKRSLKTHERVPKFLGNLFREISQVKNPNRAKIKMCVYDLTEIYIRRLNVVCEERIMSDIKKNAILAAAEAQKEREQLSMADSKRTQKAEVFDAEEEG